MNNPSPAALDAAREIFWRVPINNMTVVEAAKLIQDIADKAAADGARRMQERCVAEVSRAAGAGWSEGKIYAVQHNIRQLDATTIGRGE